VAKKTPTPKPTVADSRAIIVTLKGNPEFRDWLNRFAEFDRSTAVQITEKALVAYARQLGFEEPAPKRTEGK